MKYSCYLISMQPLHLKSVSYNFLYVLTCTERDTGLNSKFLSEPGASSVWYWFIAALVAEPLIRTPIVDGIVIQFKILRTFRNGRRVLNLLWF